MITARAADEGGLPEDGRRNRPGDPLGAPVALKHSASPSLVILRSRPHVPPQRMSGVVK